jgi:hypothetical protein
MNDETKRQLLTEDANVHSHCDQALAASQAETAAIRLEVERLREGLLDAAASLKSIEDEAEAGRLTDQGQLVDFCVRERGRVVTALATPASEEPTKLGEVCVHGGLRAQLHAAETDHVPAAPAAVPQKKETSE